MENQEFQIRILEPKYKILQIEKSHHNYRNFKFFDIIGFHFYILGSLKFIKILYCVCSKEDG